MFVQVLLKWQESLKGDGDFLNDLGLDIPVNTYHFFVNVPMKFHCSVGYYK